MKKRFFILVAVVMLLACGSKEKDAQYYTNHPEEMKQKMEECTKMSTAEKMADRECSAVSQAHSKKFFGDKIEKPGEGQGKELPKF